MIQEGCAVYYHIQSFENLYFAWSVSGLRPYCWKKSLAFEEEKLFLNSAIEYFRSIGADMIIPATTNTIFRTYPDGAVVAPYGSYIIDLRHPEDTLWSNLHSKHRNVIRNAMKKGVEIRSGIEYLDTSL